MMHKIEKINIIKNKEKPKDDIGIKLEEREGLIRNFCNEVLILENKEGEGNFSNVFSDPLKNYICYKRYKPEAESRMSISFMDEVGFLKDVYGLHDNVKTPYLVASATTLKIDTKTGNKSIDKIIAMRFFKNSTKLEDILKSKEGINLPLPDNFNVETFFSELEDFIKKMHKKGIYHRDIAARNILINNDTGYPIVIDFGDSSYTPINDKYDAYGRLANDENEDVDLKRARQIKEEMLKLLKS